MLIGHTGRTRIEEFVLSAALLVIAARTALPLGGLGAYGHLSAKIAFAVAILVPAVWLLLARSLASRARALFWTFVTYAYVAALVLIVDWTRFGSAAAILALAAIAGYLYYVTAREIKWIQGPSPQSSPPSGPDSS